MRKRTQKDPKGPQRVRISCETLSKRRRFAWQPRCGEPNSCLRNLCCCRQQRSGCHHCRPEPFSMRRPSFSGRFSTEIARFQLVKGPNGGLKAWAAAWELHPGSFLEEAAPCRHPQALGSLAATENALNPLEPGQFHADPVRFHAKNLTKTMENH